MQEVIADIEKALDAYPDSLKTYRHYTEEHFIGKNILASLAMDRKLVVGTQQAVADHDDSIAITAVCPESGILEIVSKFESVLHVPIGNVTVTVWEVDGADGWFGTKNDKKVNEKTADNNGRAVFTGLTPGTLYRFTINDEASQSDLDALFGSYDGFIADNHAGLTQHWAKYKPEWQGSALSHVGRTAGSLVTGIAAGIWGALEDIWNGITTAFELLKDPASIPDKLGGEFAELAESVKAAIAGAPDLAEKAMLFASDEAALFVLVKRCLLWFSMIPPANAVYETTKAVTKFVVAIVIDIVISIVLAILSAKAAGLLGIGFLATRIAARVEKMGQWFVKVGKAVLEFFEDLADMASKYAKDLKDYKKVAVRGDKPARLHQEGQEVQASFDNEHTTRIDTQDNTPDNPEQARNGNNDPVDSNDNTATNSCPVSMVTGEELLELEDARLPALIDLPFVRTYRTSNCENSDGLGFGWSHSLAHKIHFKPDIVEWTDHEGRTTSLPLPDQRFGRSTNKMAGTAIYLGQEEQEYVLTSNSVAPYFYHFKKHGETGYLTAITDRHNNRLDLRYDADRRIIRVESEHGSAFGIRYHGVTRLISAVEQLTRQSGRWQSSGVLAQYEYNQAHQLIKASNANGEAECYQYDDHNVIQLRRMAGGAEFYWQWQGEGKTVKAVRHWANFDQMDVRYEWSDDGKVTVLYKDGSSQSYQHDENARLIQQVDPDGAVTEKVYGEKGELLQETDPLGNKTEYKYDSQQQLIAVVQADGTTVGYQYKHGKLIEKNAQGSQWHYSYNDQGDLIKERDPLGHETRYSYNEQGFVSAIQYADGSSARYQWNRLGQLLEQTAPDGGKTRYRYDAFGRRIWQQDAAGAITEYRWDAAGRLIALREPGAKRAKNYSYNAYGKVTAVTDEHGQTTQYEYQQPLHLLTAKINPDGSRTEYRYDNAKLFLSEILNERGERCELEYHPNGLISQERSFDGRTTHYQYDLNGQLTESIEVGRKGTELATTYERDPVGRLIRKTLPDGQQIEYRYDAQGQLSEIDDGQWPLSYEYDAVGQLKVEHQGWGTLLHEYDPLGRLVQMRLPDHQQLNYHYQQGRLTQTDLNGEMLTRHHHQHGREQYRQQGQLTSHYQYDDQGRLQQHTVNQREQHAADPSRTVHRQQYKRAYSYSDNGNLATLEDSRKGKRQYHYDALDRLQQVSGSLEELFIHDPAGNLLDNTGNSTVAEGNQLSLKGDRHYDYDEFGNLIAERRGKGQQLVTHYHYDSQHRLVKAELPNGGVAEYCYDAYGRRISKSVTENNQTQKTVFFWQGEKLVAEVDEQSDTQTSYIYEPYSFKPMAMLQGSGADTEVYYYQLDHLGTPQELTDKTGQIVWSAQYRAYGQLAIAEIETVTNPLRFQGQYHDLETGLYYNRHRYYDPHSARFTTIDPIGLAGGLNNYQYVPNPTGWIDPLGLACEQGDCPGVSSEIPETNYVYFNKTHKDSLPKPKGRGPNGGRLQSHHGLQQQWAKENLAEYGYDANLAPSVTLETGKGLPHTVISNGQNTRRNARVESGQGKWSSGLQDELQYIVDDMSGAGFQLQTINLVLDQQYKMLDKLNVPYQKLNQ